MKISAQLLIPLLSIATACGGSGSTDATKPANTSNGVQQSQTLPTDSEIAALVYDNAYIAPDEFFVDERAATDRSYTVHHVLDSSLSYERCTDDYAEALQWEESDNASRSVQGYYVESYENDRYYEVARELSYEQDIGNIDDITSPGFARVFKCSYTIRDGVDRSVLSGFSGTLNTRPIDAASIREFTEYLWQFRFFPNGRNKVIASSGTESPDQLQHTLLLAFSTNQGSGNCDLIEVVEWRFNASRDTGQVTRQFDVVHSFEAETSSGLIRICD